MKKLLCVLFLAGCTTQTPVSENITNNAINATTAVEQSLSKECKTQAIKTQLDNIKTQITTISKTCEIEKEQLKSDKIKWQTAFYGLLLAIGIFIIKKVL